MESAQTMVLETSDHGISQTYQAWQKAGANKTTRTLFYQNIIEDHIRKLEKSSGISLDQIPLVLSGMASSSIGMMELPYSKFPFVPDGSGIEVKFMPSTNGFPHNLLLVSGAASENDVMRGEETLLVGCVQEDFLAENTRIIFPGTHSKHITVQRGLATEVKTYMTGEFFDLLSRQSILSSVINKSEWTGDDSKRDSFRKGIKTGIRSNLLHGAFSVRVNSLLHHSGPEDNYHYLSGLLIGNELPDLVNNPPSSLVLVSEGVLGTLYNEALDVLGIKSSLDSFRITDATDALIRGQLTIFRNYTIK